MKTLQPSGTRTAPLSVQPPLDPYPAHLSSPIRCGRSASTLKINPFVHKEHKQEIVPSGRIQQHYSSPSPASLMSSYVHSSKVYPPGLIIHPDLSPGPVIDQCSTLPFLVPMTAALKGRGDIKLAVVVCRTLLICSSSSRVRQFRHFKALVWQNSNPDS